jgi:hypothetical protein
MQGAASGVFFVDAWGIDRQNISMRREGTLRFNQLTLLQVSPEAKGGSTIEGRFRMCSVGELS